MENNKPRITIGSVVVLNHEKDFTSPTFMTVTDLQETRPNSSHVWICAWIYDGEVKNAKFHQDALTVIDN